MPVRTRFPIATRRAVLSAATVTGAGALLAACSSSSSTPKASGSASAAASPSTSAAVTASTPVSAPASKTASASASAKPTATIPPKLTVTAVADLAKITVVGEPDKQPKLTYPTPTVAKKTTAKAVIVGKGAKVTAGQEVTIDYTLYVGSADKVVQSSYQKQGTTPPAPFTFTASTGTGIIPGFVKSVVGFTVGSRVLIAITPADGYQATAQSGIPANSTLLFVVDIHAAKDKLTHAVGAAVPPKAGLPAVTVVKDIPTAIAKPTGTPPTALVVQPLIQGTGPVLKKGSPVAFQYIVDLWTTDSRNGTLIDKSWGGTTTPTVQALGASSVDNTNTLIAGLNQALTGQKVGSRILVVVPPKLGYPNGNGPIKKTDTTVWCIDILDNIISS